MSYLEMYKVQGGATPDQQAVRYWAVVGVLLVGGRINDEHDAAHLRDTYRIGHVLSAESEQDDPRCAGVAFARFAFPDTGEEPAQSVIRGAGAFIVEALDVAARGALYVHCRLGGSRGPALAYMALRILGRTREEAADQCGRRQQGCGELHPAYVVAIERALT